MKKIVVLLVLTILLSGCIVARPGLTSKESKIVDGLEGQEYYALTNIWYTAPNEISSQNFHKGELLRVGTKVIIGEHNGIRIRFSDGSDKTYIMSIYRSSRINLLNYFNRYFSKENVMANGGRFYKFTEQEQKNIKQGKIDYGMSKEAVLMAYGYPPLNRTKRKELVTTNISNSKWLYLEDNDFFRTMVYFENNKVTKIEDIQLGHRKPGGRGEKITVRGSEIQSNVMDQKGSNADEILKYKKLLDSGAITKEEYEQKKQQLLGL